jgi:hypothetical protein
LILQQKARQRRGWRAYLFGGKTRSNFSPSEEKLFHVAHAEVGIVV